MSNGTIRELWRYPVKGMRGERLDSVPMEPAGLLGDRAFGILDVESGKIAFASNVRDFPDLLRYQGRYVDGHGEIVSPQGDAVRSDDPRVDEVLSRWFGRPVRLTRTAPAGYLESRARFMNGLGVDVPSRVQPLHDCAPLSVMTTATLEALAAAEPDTVFDVRRFRMNLLVDVDAKGFPENDWVGREVTIGEAARMRVVVLDPRCVVTTLEVEGLAKDPRVLKTVARANSRTVGPAGALPCAGVYAEVMTPGPVRAGDPVEVLG